MAGVAAACDQSWLSGEVATSLEPSLGCIHQSLHSNTHSFTFAKPQLPDMHTHTRKWINPEIQRQKERNQERVRLNTARRKFCPSSPFFHANFDHVAHKAEYDAGRHRALAGRAARKICETTERKRLGLPPRRSVKPPFRNHCFADNCAPVTAWRTIFTPAYDSPARPRNPADPLDKEPGLWPSRAEMKYEGDERISTDVLHGRCLPAPRVDGTETVNWMHRDIVPQYPLDDFHYPPPHVVEIWMRTHYIAELEVSDSEGFMLLGRELMKALDPTETHC